MYLLVDIGGTKTRIAGTLDLENFVDPIVASTPQEYDKGLNLIVEGAERISNGLAIKGVAVGFKGEISEDRKATLVSPLLDWQNKSLAGDLSARLHTDHIILENDTATVGLGEAIYGAGKGSSVLVYYTVSTGVGGVRLLDGKIDRSAHGFEPGGQYLSMNPQKTIEEYVSGAAVTERFGMLPQDIAKDSPVWEELARTFAFALHNSILHWSPERIVLGGSMFNEVGIPIPRVAEHVKSLMRKFKTTPDIVHSSLGDFGGLWGGIALLKQKIH